MILTTRCSVRDVRLPRLWHPLCLALWVPTRKRSSSERALLRKGGTMDARRKTLELPERYRSVGQPVMVPGDMGRYSFVLAGTEGAMSETFGSSAHGAGRKMGRKKAKKAAKGRNIRRELEDKGILIRAANRATIDEEMSEAYKDATEVVDTTEGAGIGKKVARLRPLIVVKG